MKDKIIITICDRHRENTENVRITGHTQKGEVYTFHIVGDNAWRFESCLKEGTQILLCPIETYAVYYVTEKNQRIRIPAENNITVQLEKARHLKEKNTSV